MGNLEEPLTEDTGRSLSAAPYSTGCHQFRAPPSYAKHLKDAGFQLLNQANNHGNDYGLDGLRGHPGGAGEIRSPAHGCGRSDHRRRGQGRQGRGRRLLVVRVEQQPDRHRRRQGPDREGGLAGPTSWWCRCTWAPRASNKTRVKPGTEMFLGENRGDPVKFAHAMIDAGADLIVGHGPHVLRGDGVLQGAADRLQPGQLRRWWRHAQPQRPARPRRGAQGRGSPPTAPGSTAKWPRRAMNSAGKPVR